MRLIVVRSIFPVMNRIDSSSRLLHLRFRLRVVILLLCVLLPPLKLASQAWQPCVTGKSCGSDSSLYGLAFSADGVIVAVGEDGVGFISRDAGASFVPMQVGTDADLYDVAFRDASSLVVCGDSGLVLRSNDGGLRWTTLAINGFTSRALYSMLWLDSATGLIAGGASAVAHGSPSVPDGCILRATDGGNSWQAVISDIMIFYWSLARAVESGGERLYAGGYGPVSAGRILVSSDRGRTWNVAIDNLPFLPHDIATGIAGDRAVTVGGNPFVRDAGPRLAVKDSSGLWHVFPDTLKGGFAWSVSALPHAHDSSASLRLVCGLNSASLLVSEDGGATWREQRIAAIRCPVYSLAARRIRDGDAFSTVAMAAGSGRGLFRAEDRMSSSMHPSQKGPASAGISAEIFPLPVQINKTQRIMVRVNGIAGQRLQLALYDALGRCCLETACGRQIDNTVLMSMEGGHLYPGLHILRIVSDGSVLALPLTVLP